MSWKQPERAAAGGKPPSRDKLSAGAASPKESSERLVEPTEEEEQPTEDPQFLHQAKGLGSEFSPGPDSGLGGDTGC